MGFSVASMSTSIISVIDFYGGHEWDLFSVAVTSAAIFLSIRLLLGKKYGVDWDAFVHALLTAIFSCICQYYNSFLADEMRGHPEPYGSISKCLGPLTSLHRIVPSMTLGYAICDIINGFTLGVDALAHGFATFTVMAAFVYLDASHIIAPMLTMEVSTMFLAIMRGEFFTPGQKIGLQFVFTITFFITRVLLTPYLMVGVLMTIYHDQGECIHPALFWVTLIFSIFFTGLNIFWFYKIVQKINRKLSGKESMADVERKES